MNQGGSEMPVLGAGVHGPACSLAGPTKYLIYPSFAIQ